MIIAGSPFSLLRALTARLAEVPHELGLTAGATVTTVFALTYKAGSPT